MSQEVRETNTNIKHFDEILQLVTFYLSKEEFAVDILNIQGINRMIEITAVPNAPDFVEGVINLRGKVIPLVNLRKRMGMQPQQWDRSTRFIVVEFTNKVIGFIVDSVSEVLRISKDTIEPPPPMMTGVNADYVTAVAKVQDRLLILLDLQKILTLSEAESLDIMIK